MIRLEDAEQNKIVIDKETENYEKIRQFAIYLQNAREEERSKIARELHDELGQYLTLLKMDLQSVISNPELSFEAIVQKIKKSFNLIDQAIDITRKIISELRLAILDHLGLVPAIEHQIEEFEERTNIKVESYIDKEIKLDKELSLSLFRISQELLTNVIKHSNATAIKYFFGKNSNNLIMSISDNGIGIDKNELAHKNSFGLIGIRERVRLYNGELIIDSEKGKGTTVTITIPIKL